MSYGKKSHLFRPVEADMLPFLESMFPAARAHVRPIFEILSDHCVVESLLLVSVLDNIDRYLKNERDRGGISSGIVLSIISKDGSGKMQTQEMELVHDVLVELQMAGMNFRNLQTYLRKNNMEFVFMHSCGGDITGPDMVDVYFESVKHEQYLRTRLDWDGQALKNVSVRYALSHGRDAAKIIATIKRIVTMTEQMLAEKTVPIAHANY
jgi:hypothetical protein